MSSRTTSALPSWHAALRLVLATLLLATSFVLARPEGARAAYPYDDNNWPANPGYDVVYGGAWSRAKLIEWMWLYKKYGFNENFAYYSADTITQVKSPDTRRWATRMPYYYSGGNGSVGPDANGLYMTRLDAVFLPGASVRVWSYGTAFIGKVCGNHSQVVSNPAPPRISGIRYVDSDMDGVRDAGEPGAAGLGVSLYKGTALCGTTVTDATGRYEFVIDATQGLAPGSYQVRSVAEPGWTATSSTQRFLTVYEGATSAGRDYSGYDFGGIEHAEIGGVLYFDADADGTRDPGEEAVSGRTVTLAKNGGAFSTAVSSADGTYVFSGLLPAQYVVGSPAPEGWRLTQPASGSYSMALGSGESTLDADFGSLVEGSIRPYKVNDLDADGVEDEGEPLLAGWTMHLGDLLLAELRPPALTTEDRTSTPAWTQLLPDSYTVWEDPQDGWTATTASERRVDLGPGQQVAVGFLGSQLGEVRAVTFHDLNLNGIPEESEPRLDRVIDLKRDGEVIATASTGDDGAATFSDLVAGDYEVCEHSQPWWRETTDPVQSVALAAGQSVEVAFGDFHVGAVEGQVIEDLDGDGSAEPGEPAAAGVSVTLATADGAIVGEPAVTDAEGRYAFGDVAPGDYAVTGIVPDGWLAASPVSAAVSVAGGAASAASAFLLTEGITVEGMAFDDSDCDGSCEAGEAGIAGREVVLERNVDGAWIACSSALTGADGSFCFDLLQPGEYRVIETLPDGWRRTLEPAALGFLESGELAVGNEFGSIGLSALEIGLFDDADGDGVREEGEGGLVGRTVDVIGTGVDGGAFSRTVTSGNDGRVRIDDVLPGSYNVRPHGIDRVTAGDGSVVEPGWRFTTSEAADIALRELEVGAAEFGALQMGWISGRILHDVWGTPVAGLTVLIEETGERTVTDADGRYFFYDVAPNGTALCPTGDYLVGIDLAGTVWKTPGAVDKSVTVSRGGLGSVDFSVYEASLGNQPKTVAYWKNWDKSITRAQMETYVGLVNAGSAEFAAIGVDDVYTILQIDKRTSARAKARAQYLAFWLNVASGNLGYDTSVDVSAASSWQEYLESALPNGLTTVLGVIHDMEEVFVQQWLPAAWDAIRSILDGINTGSYT